MPPRILIISGGTSEERSVSLESGAAVQAALEEAGYGTGLWDPANIDAEAFPFADWDLAFPVLHGTGGEDGRLQNLLKKNRLPWIGSSAEASVRTFDKIQTRRLLSQQGIPVAPGMCLHEPASDCPDEFPVVVKPARQGSSIGISLVRHRRDWDAAVRNAYRLCDDIVVEQFISGREVSVPVIYGHLLPAVEVLPDGVWYDFDSKYRSQSTQYRADPPDLPPEVLRLARQACQACQVDGIARVDFRIDRAGRPFVLEINTIPGMTSHSLVPISAAAAGLSLPELCDRCVRHRLGEKPFSVHAE